MTIRKLQPAEWSAYQAIRLRSLITDPHAFEATLEGNLARPDEYWQGRLESSLANDRCSILFALDEERPVGMVAIWPHEEPGAVELISVYVVPEDRGRGIARQLLTSLFDLLPPRETVRLAVVASQTAAVHLYRSLGFAVRSEREAAHPDGSRHRLIEMTRLL